MLSLATVLFSSAVALVIVLLSPGPLRFDQESCNRLRNKLENNLFGQTLASSQLTNAICDHLVDDGVRKPLVISIHGPPGVGKSYFHFLAARSMYNISQAEEKNCPGDACIPYKVIFGLDYIEEEQDNQSNLLIGKLLEHLQQYKESLIVIEEYDKLNCKSRGVLKQLFDKGFAANITAERSVFLLESNTGYGKIVEALSTVGYEQDKVDVESLQYTLKNMMFNTWSAEGCEDRVDTIKSLSLIDMYVPFFPLDKQAIEKILDHYINRRVEIFNRGRKAKVAITWDQSVLDFLSKKIEWDGRFTVEGAKEVSTAIKRYVFAPLFIDTPDNKNAQLAEMHFEVDKNSNALVLK